MRRTLPFLLLALAACGGQATSPSPPPVTVTQATGAITLAEFERIEQGMTYDEVVAVVGAPGTVSSEFKAQPVPGMADMSTKTYSWEGAGVATMASVTFQGGKVTSKTQFGLA